MYVKFIYLYIEKAMEANTTKIKIIELGREYMQSVGYHSFNYKQIATALNIKHPSIHYYFPTKEDLALAVIEKDKLDFRSFIEAIKDLKPSEKVQALLDNYSGYFKDGKKLCIISTFGTVSNDAPERICQAASVYGKEVHEWFCDTLKDGLKTGEFKFEESLDGTAALWMATLPGSLLVGRLHGVAYFDQVLNLLKASLNRK